jgi:hypothetical protein
MRTLNAKDLTPELADILHRLRTGITEDRILDKGITLVKLEGRYFELGVAAGLEVTP